MYLIKCSENGSDGAGGRLCTNHRCRAAGQPGAVGYKIRKSQSATHTHHTPSVLHLRTYIEVASSCMCHMRTANLRRCATCHSQFSCRLLQTSQFHIYIYSFPMFRAFSKYITDLYVPWHWPLTAHTVSLHGWLAKESKWRIEGDRTLRVYIAR